MDTNEFISHEKKLIDMACKLFVIKPNNKHLSRICYYIGEYELQISHHIMKIRCVTEIDLISISNLKIRSFFKFMKS